MSLARCEPKSLTECFEHWLFTYVRLPARTGASVRAAVLSRSPIYFDPGDMRREYGWRRALLTAAGTLVIVALGIRLLLTGLFVILVSNDISLIVAFNLCATLLLGRHLFGAANTDPRTVRRVVAPRPSRSQSNSRSRYSRFSGWLSRASKALRASWVSNGRQQL